MASTIASAIGRPDDYLTKSQTKILQTTLSASAGSIPELEFNNLIVGRWYRLNIHPYFLDANSSQMELRSFNGATFLNNSRLYSSSGSNHLESSDLIEFEATETTILWTFSINSGTNGSLVSGSTRATLTQLPVDYIQTTDFT